MNCKTSACEIPTQFEWPLAGKPHAYRFPAGLLQGQGSTEISNQAQPQEYRKRK
jgi:hypothetical protein